MSEDPNTRRYVAEPTEGLQIEGQSFATLIAVTAAIRFYYQIIISLLGIIGNILTILVLLTKPLRDKTSSYYFIAIAVADFCVLVVSTVWWSSMYVNTTSVWSCKVMLLVFYSAAHFSVTTLMAVTTERFIAVMWPLKASVWITKSRTRVVLSCIVLFVIAVDSQNIFTRTMLRLSNNATTCLFSNIATHSSPFAWFHMYVWPYLDALVYCFIPITYILLLNILIIFALVRAAKQQLHLQETNTTAVATSQKQVTVMLLSVSTAFLILTLPIAVMVILEKVWNYSKSAYATAVWKLLRAISANLMYTQHAINFPLFLASNKTFRRKVKDIFSFSDTERYDSKQSLSKTDSTGEGHEAKLKMVD